MARYGTVRVIFSSSMYEIAFDIVMISGDSESFDRVGAENRMAQHHVMAPQKRIGSIKTG